MAQSLWVNPWKEDTFAFCHHHNVSYNHRVNDEGEQYVLAPLKRARRRQQPACLRPCILAQQVTYHAHHAHVWGVSQGVPEPVLICRSLQLVRGAGQGVRRRVVWCHGGGACSPASRQILSFMDPRGWYVRTKVVLKAQRSQSMC